MVEKESRPSPRTQGVSAEGETFQKFGTQQLKFVAGTPPQLGVPYQGVTQVNTGKGFKGFTTTIFPSSGITTAFSKQFGSYNQPHIQTGVQRIFSREEALEMQKTKLESMGIPEIKLPDFGNIFSDLFGPQPNDKHGCECEACKNGTGQCSERRAECDSWDVPCELGGGLADFTTGITEGFAEGVTNPVSSWWEKYGIWVYVILGVIGFGVLLWLLRPLFSMIGAFKGGSP